MPKNKEIEEYMQNNFFQCPICKSDEGYRAKGIFIKTISCLKCGAKFQSQQFKNLEPLKEMTLCEFPRDGRYAYLYLKKKNVKFWKKLDSNNHLVLNGERSKSINLKKNEVVVDYLDGCTEFFGDKPRSRKTLGQKGCLIVTNQRIIFSCRMKRHKKRFVVTYEINLENIRSVSQGKVSIVDKLLILNKNNQQREFIKPGIQLIIPSINDVLFERKDELKDQNKNKVTPIVPNISSQKDLKDEKDVGISVHKCIKCKNMLKISEDAKILFCKYCGTRIKPIEF